MSLSAVQGLQAWPLLTPPSNLPGDSTTGIEGASGLVSQVSQEHGDKFNLPKSTIKSSFPQCRGQGISSRLNDKQVIWKGLLV